MNILDTSNSNNYKYTTKHLEIHILGGLKTNKLESMRITLSIQKLKQENILRHTIDLYNDNQVEKFVRKVAERLEVGTSIVRRTLQEVTKELENYRFLLLQEYEGYSLMPLVVHTPEYSFVLVSNSPTSIFSSSKLKTAL